MIILTIRTDKPEAEIGLYDNDERLAYEKWPAHRQLAETIHTKIEELLKSCSDTWQDIEGIVCFQGPGSFTGLRIGLSVSNAISYGLNVPIVATQNDDWIKHGLKRLQKGDSDRLALPHYGSPPHITLPHK
jgi:tRNA threonylcarbamoyladenosine biosynthesis protein TsaB